MNITRIAAVVAGVALVITSAPAAAGARVDSRCVDKGVINIYGVVLESIDVPAGGGLDTFEEALCRYGKKDRLRIYKSAADTEREVAVLRAWAADRARPGDPALFCGSETSGYLLDLAQAYAIGVKTTNRAERRHYEAWATKRAANNPVCEIYVG